MTPQASGAGVPARHVHLGFLLVALAAANACVGRVPNLACADDSDCAAGFACSESKGACVLIAVNDGEGEGEAGEGEGEGEGDEGEGEGEGGEGEGEGALVFTRFEREPATPTVVAHEPLTLHWRVSDNAATCVLTSPDGTELDEASSGSVTFRPAIDGAMSVRCASAGEEVSESTSFDVVLPAAVDASWHPPFIATHPWRLDVTFTTAARRRAFPVDVPIDLVGALRAAGVADDEVPSPDSVRAVRVAPDGDLAVLDPYFSAETGLLFVRLPPLAAGASVVVHVYFAPAGAPAWSEASYDDNHAGAAEPIRMNRDSEGIVALLDVNGFDASPFDTQDVLYERGARLVVGAQAVTTPVHFTDAGPQFPSIISGPTLRVDNSEVAVIEQRVQGVGGVDIVEVVTLAKADPPAIRFTTVLVNTTGAVLSNVRYSSLMDLDVPGVTDLTETSNSARAIGAVPAVCDSSGALCGALAGEASTGFRVGTFPGSSDDFVADQFIGVTDASFLDDKRLAVTWLVPSLGAQQVLHSALAINETIDFTVADAEAVANASSLADMPAVTYSPTWIRD